MALYTYDYEKLARLMGLTFNDKPGPYGQFYRDNEPVGYVDRPGVVFFLDEIQIPDRLPLQRL